MGAGRSVATWSSVVVLAVLVLPALSVSAAGSAPVLTVGASAQQWAYGAQHWKNQSAAGLGGTFNSSAYVGWTVVFTATNTSSTTIEIEGVRTIAEHYYGQFCHPNCSAPNATAVVSLRAWQQERAFVNLTTAATVYERTGGSAPMATAALGILNATDRATAKLDTTFRIARAGSTVASGALSVSRTAGISVDFTPALGLVPWNLTGNDSWNSTSAFTAHGGWNDSYTFADSLRGAGSNSSGTSTGSVGRSGTESLRGADRGNVTLSNGRTASVVVLGFLGPFDFGDGLFPSASAGSSLFGGGGSAWSADAYGTVYGATTASDVIVSRLHHTAVFAAASASYGIGASALGSSTMTSGSVTGAVGPAAPGPSAPPSDNESLQMQPESVDQANQQSTCMVSGCGPNSTGNPLFSSGPGLILLGVAVGAVVLAGIGIAMWARPKRPGSMGVEAPTGK